MFWTGGVADTSPQSPAGGSRVCASCLNQSTTVEVVFGVGIATSRWSCV